MFVNPEEIDAVDIQSFFFGFQVFEGSFKHRSAFPVHTVREEYTCECFILIIVIVAVPRRIQKCLPISICMVH